MLYVAFIVWELISAKTRISRWVYAISRVQKMQITSNLRTLADTSLRWKWLITSNLRPVFGTDWWPNTLILDQIGNSRVTCTLYWPNLWWKLSFTSNLRTGFSTNWRPNTLILAQNCNSRATCTLALEQIGDRTLPFQIKIMIIE